MGVWRYCEHCNAGQDRITIEDLAEISYDPDAEVMCHQCNKPRGDDTPAARTMILVNAVKERDERLNSLENRVAVLIKATRQLAKRGRP